MSSYDLVIRGGTIVDGTGTPGYRGDLALAGGRIAAVGRIRGAARQVLDAGGLVVAPGFIDIHTHYDAQAIWDPLLSSSVEHGVTTVVTGNCGIGVAPCRPGDREVTMRDLVSLEGIAFETLDAGLDWAWESFPEYLQRLNRTGLGANLVPLAPLATFRRYAMGDAASDRAADAEETAAVAALLRTAIEAGAHGFSTTTVLRQKGYRGRPLACTLASRAELGAYARVLRDLRCGVIQGNVSDQLSDLSDDEFDLLDHLLEESGQPLSWSGALHRADRPDAVYRMLDKAAPLLAKGGIPQSTTRPMTNVFDFKTPFMLTDCPTVAQRALNRSKDELRQVYADPRFRTALRADLDKGDKVYSPIWREMRVLRAQSPALARHAGRAIAEIAAERGCDPFDLLFDLFLEDDLELKYLGGVRNTDRAALKTHIADPRLLIGMSDGGAHVDMLFECSYPTYMLGHWVREAGAMSLERAVQRMTAEPAHHFAMPDRGRLAPGLIADVTLFDPATVGSPERADEVRRDMPGGGERLYARARGVEAVIVNGVPVMQGGRPRGTLPGRAGMPRDSRARPSEMAL